MKKTFAAIATAAALLLPQAANAAGSFFPPSTCIPYDPDQNWSRTWDGFTMYGRYEGFICPLHSTDTSNADTFDDINIRFNAVSGSNILVYVVAYNRSAGYTSYVSKTVTIVSSGTMVNFNSTDLASLYGYQSSVAVWDSQVRWFG